jgi:hypothetical protein
MCIQQSKSLRASARQNPEDRHSGFKTILQLAADEITQYKTKVNFLFDACQGCVVVEAAKALAFPDRPQVEPLACGELGRAQKRLDEDLAADLASVVRPKMRATPPGLEVITTSPATGFALNVHAMDDLRTGRFLPGRVAGVPIVRARRELAELLALGLGSRRRAGCATRRGRRRTESPRLLPSECLPAGVAVGPCVAVGARASPRRRQTTGIRASPRPHRSISRRTLRKQGSRGSDTIEGIDRSRVRAAPTAFSSHQCVRVITAAAARLRFAQRARLERGTAQCVSTRDENVCSRWHPGPIATTNDRIGPSSALSQRRALMPALRDSGGHPPSSPAGAVDGQS